MTTWYRRPRAKRALAYSVRPDLWPAGTYAKALGRSWVHLAVWVMGDWPLQIWAAEAAPYSAPGAAEALILAGSVQMAQTPASSYSWVPREAP